MLLEKMAEVGLFICVFVCCWTISYIKRIFVACGIHILNDFYSVDGSCIFRLIIQETVRLE